MSRWDYKGEYGLAASYREMWGRIMEWANGEHQATLPDLDYVAETCRETDAELTRLRSLAARAEEAERESADIVKAYEEGMERISRKEGYVELENKIVELAAELEEAVAHAKRLEEYMLKGVAFRDELQGQLCAAREAGERMVWCDVMSALRSSSPCAHAKEAGRLNQVDSSALSR